MYDMIIFFLGKYIFLSICVDVKCILNIIVYNVLYDFKMVYNLFLLCFIINFFLICSFFLWM